MILAALLLGCLSFAGAQRIHGGWPQLDSWAASYPEISSPRISQLSFQDDKEYRYVYDGQILTGLPETAKQFSGLRLRALFTIQLRSGVDVFQIERISLGKMNEQIVRGPLALQPLDLFEELQGDEAAEFEEALTKPLRFEYNSGLITDMESMNSDPFWSVNIKRSILSIFNLNLKNQASPMQRGSPFMGRLGRQENLDDVQYFTVMEEGIGGECEAVYLVQSLPVGSLLDGSSPVSGSLMSSAGVLNVTKSWDYTKCRSRAISIESLADAVQKTGIDKSDDKKEELIDSAAHTRYNIIGKPNQYVIESASTEGVHKFTPYSQEAGSLTAYVNATIRLVASGGLTRDRLPTEPGNPLKGLHQLFPNLRTADPGIMEYLAEQADKPFRLPSGNWPNIAAKKALISSMLSRLVEDLADDEVEAESADLVYQMALILQYATPQELLEIHREVKLLTHQSVEQEQIKNLWMDLLALSGTKPAVLFIKSEILSEDLEGERAVQVLNTLAFSTRKPDADIVQELLDLCKSPLVQSTQEVKKACLLALGTLIHSSCVEDKQTVTNVQNILVKTGNPRCPTEAKQRFLMELLSLVKLAQKEEDEILMLKTLANSGLVGMASDLKSILKDDSKSVLVRREAIFALEPLARSYPELVLQLLIPEFHDVSNHFQVRLAAFDVIIQAKPDRPELETIARSLHQEKSVQVGSYVWSSLNTLANSTHPDLEELAQDASLALEFSKPFRTGLSFSKRFHLGGFSDNLQVGGFAEITTVGEPSSIIPRGVNIRLNGHALGLSQDLIEAGFDTEGLDLLSSLFKKLYLDPRTADRRDSTKLFDLLVVEEDDVDNDITGSRSSRRVKPFNNRPELDEIDRLLGLKDKMKEQVKGHAYLKIFGQQVRFLSLSPASIKKMLKESLKPVDLLAPTDDDKAIDFRKALMVADSKLTIPTELGLPLSVELKAPLVVSIKGKLGLKSEPVFGVPSLKSLPKSLALESDLKVSLASHVVAEINVFAGYSKIGSGMMSKLAATLPIKGEVSVDLKNGKIASSIQLPEEPLELLDWEMMPFTATKFIPKVLAAHQPDRKSQTPDRSAKIVQFNRQPLANEEPSSKLFSLKTELVENPFMLNEQAYQPTDFYRGLLMPVVEVKEVPTEDVLRTKFVHLVLGHPVMGGVLEVKGHVQMPYGVPTAPMVPIGGKNRLVLTLKPTGTIGLKTLEAVLHLRKEHFAGSTVPNWNSLYDQLVGSRSSDLLSRLVSDLPSAFSTDDKSGYSAQLVVQGRSESSQEVVMQAVFSLLSGMDDKFIKVTADVHSPHPQLPFQACFDAHASYPDQYDSDDILPGLNEPVSGQLELSVGRSCQAGDAMKLTVKLLADKSAKQLELEKNDYYSVEGAVIPVLVSKSVDPVVQMIKPLNQQCTSDRKRGLKWSDACETVKDLYSTLMQIKVDVDYQNIPLELEDLLEKCERLAHSVFYWNSEVDTARVSNPPNKLSILADFIPDEELMNIVYSTPRQNVKLLSIPVPYPLSPVSADEDPLDILGHFLEEDLEEVCSISGNRLNTLDSVEMKVPLSQCYQLLAKDASHDEMWSVLFASAGTRNPNAKQVKLLIGNRKIELLPAELVSSRLRSISDIVVRVDGRPIQLRENLEVDLDEDISVLLEKKQAAMLIVLKAEELGLELLFDGENIAIKPSFLLRNQIRGLCGNDNDEEWDDMLLPSGKLASTIEELVRSYTVQQDGCMSDLVSNEREEPRQVADCKLKTIIKYKAHEICFSVEPVQTSDGDLEEQPNVVNMRRIGFHCLPDDSSVAQRLERDAKVRLLTEIANKPVTDHFLVPEVPFCRNQAGRLAGLEKRTEWF